MVADVESCPPRALRAGTMDELSGPASAKAARRLVKIVIREIHVICGVFAFANSHSRRTVCPRNRIVRYPEGSSSRMPGWLPVELQWSVFQRRQAPPLQLFP